MNTTDKQPRLAADWSEHFYVLADDRPLACHWPRRVKQELSPINQQPWSEPTGWIGQ